MILSLYRLIRLEGFFIFHILILILYYVFCPTWDETYKNNLQRRDGFYAEICLGIEEVKIVDHGFVLTILYDFSISVICCLITVINCRLTKENERL
jgi:hypothetical protein